MSNPAYELARMALGLLLVYEQDVISSMRERCIPVDSIAAFSLECKQRRDYIEKQCQRCGIKPPTTKAAQALVSD